MDQNIQIDLKADGVFLVIEPDSTVSVSDVAAELAARGIIKYNGIAVKAAVEAKTGRPTKIADPIETKAPQEEVATDSREADFRIRISEDALMCELWYIPETGNAPHPTMEVVQGFMNSHSVTYGHDEEAIKRMIDGPVVREWIVTARGDAPENGHDAIINYKVDLDVLKPRAVGDNVDMKELGSVINVVEGQEIAEKIPAVQGKDGMTVSGKKISAYVGRDKSLPGGKGVTMSEDRLHLYADFDGNLFVKGGKLGVNPVFDVHGDVDYGVGNIDFIGPVNVHGAIREGFEVRSGSDITVEGVIEGATIESKGDLSIKVGISGSGKARVKVGGVLRANYIDQAFVRSDTKIEISEAIMHSDTACRGDIVVMGSKKGQIVGGKIQSGGELICEMLGSEMGTKTEVLVGELPEVVEERRRAEENLAQIKGELDKVDANLNFLKDQQQKAPLTPEKQTLLAKITKRKFQLKSQFEVIQKRYDELEKMKEKTRTDGCVRVKNVCHPGVTVTIRGVRYVVREALRFTQFVYDEGEIKIRSFDG